MSPTLVPSTTSTPSGPSIGIITTIAGSSTSNGFSGDNGPATSASFNNPHGVSVDAAGIVIYFYSFTFCYYF